MKNLSVGLQKTSLVDYPGRVASVFFLPGCNFACPYCHNPELVSSIDMSALVPLEQAFAHLKRRAGLITALVISGGEPALHSGLPDLVAQAKSLGLLVKLDTNGSFPDRITAAGADYLAMDLKTDPERYTGLWPHAPADAAGLIRESMAVVRGSGAAYEFRITCAPGIFGPADALAVAGLLEPVDPVFLQAYHPGRVLDPDWAAGVRPYVDSEMDSLLEIIRERAPLARIRGR
ncbi:MAG: anaerobic ribonucleoside-triphosphate reductase activating protein [Spirochaetota bacterium]